MNVYDMSRLFEPMSGKSLKTAVDAWAPWLVLRKDSSGREMLGQDLMNTIFSWIPLFPHVGHEPIMFFTIVKAVCRFAFFCFKNKTCHRPPKPTCLYLKNVECIIPLIHHIYRSFLRVVHLKSLLIFGSRLKRRVPFSLGLITQTSGYQP